MKFTVTIIDIEPMCLSAWRVSYKVESEWLNFTGTEYFEKGLPNTGDELSSQTAERVRAKVMNIINTI